MDRVLILSEECNPDWPSLPVVAFKQLLSLSFHADLVIATHIRNKPQLDKVGIGKAEIVYIDNEYIAKPFYQISKLLRGGDEVGMTLNTASRYLPYLSFEWEVWKRFKGRLQAGEFDLMHRLTPMSPTHPSLLVKWSPVPFIIGPLNGGLAWPKEFEPERKRENEWLSKFRHLHKILPYYKATYSHAAKILAAFDHTMRDIPSTCRDKVISFPEIGIDPNLFNQTERKFGKRKTMLFAGRLVPCKCLDIVIHAVGRSMLLQKHHLQIVGSGPEEVSLKELVNHYRIEGCVEFLGLKTQQELGEIMRKAHILTFPSIRELGAGVVIEAMASGLCCVVVNYGAPGSLVYSANVGIKVPLKSKEEIIVDYTLELEKLVEDDDRLVSISSFASKYANNNFTWDTKSKALIRIYSGLLRG